MSTTWILAADRAKARLFSFDEHDKSITEIENFVNPGGRGHAPAQDRPARTHDRMGKSSHRIQPHTSEQEKSAESFARELDEALERGRTSHLYQALVLIAPPRFLGALHAAMDEEVRSCVVAQLSKDLTSAGAEEILDHLPSRFH